MKMQFRRWPPERDRLHSARRRSAILAGCVLRMVLSLALLATVHAPPAYAQDDAIAAKAHFSKASRLYEIGDYRQALDEFKAAHLAKADPVFLYNIAQCHRQLGEREQAVTLYRRFLASSPNAPNRSEVQRRVAELEAELAAARPEQPPTDPLPAPIVRATNTPPVPPSTWSPHPSVIAEDGKSPGTNVSVAEPAGSGSALSTLRWVGVGATLALAGGAIAAGVSASSKYDDLKNSCGNTYGGCSASQVDSVKSRALLTNVLWGLAGVAAVTTGVLFYMTPHESGVQMAWRF
jgi:tetratricopeptide (TPR) repeat protein